MYLLNRTDKGAVQFLTDANFAEFRVANPRFLAMMYAPWCGHCKNMKPAYTELSTQLEDQFVMAAIDCTVEKATCDSFGVKGFPTLKYFNGEGEPEAYEGGRSKEAMLEFANKKIEESPPKPVDIMALDFKTIKLKEVKKLLAQRGKECKGCTDRSEFIDLLKASADAPLVDKNKPKPFTGKSSLKNGRTFMQERRYKAAKEYADKGWPEGNGAVTHLIDDKGHEGDLQDFLGKTAHALVMFYRDECGHCVEFKPKMAAVSEHKDMKGKMKFASIDCDTNPGPCQEANISAYPSVRYFKDGKWGGKSAQYTHAHRDEDALRTFAQNMLDGVEYAGTLEPTLWDDNGKVVHLTDRNFAAFRKENPSSFVMFYAPWCGHCKSMKPELAKASTMVTGPIIAAVDCTEEKETCAEFNVSSFPTIKYFGATEEDNEEYSGMCYFLSLSLALALFFILNFSLSLFLLSQVPEALMPS